MRRITKKQSYVLEISEEDMIELRWLLEMTKHFNEQSNSPLNSRVADKVEDWLTFLPGLQ